MTKRQLGALFLVICLSLPNVPIVLGKENKQVIYVAGDSSGDFNCNGINDQIQINQALSYAASHPGTTVYIKGPFVGTV